MRQLCWHNYLSNNDPDTFLDMMNAKAKELGMTNTKWFNASGAAVFLSKDYILHNVMIIMLPIRQQRDLAIFKLQFCQKLSKYFKLHK